MGSALIAELERPEKRSTEQPWDAKRLRVGMLTREQCLNIYHLLARVVLMGVGGDVVELGTHAGGSAILIQKTLDSLACAARLHVYDSFAGLPANGEQDRRTQGGFYFDNGSVLAVPQRLVLQNFEAAGLRPPHIHKGWLKDTLPQELPGTICFAHLDCDLYSSTLEGLQGIFPRLSRNAIVVLDDYCEPSLFPERNILPGVKRACDEFLAGREEKIEILHGGAECHAFFVRGARVDCETQSCKSLNK